MESAFYGIYSVVFVSENSLIRYARSFVFWYAHNSCVNTVHAHFSWSIIYIDCSEDRFKNKCKFIKET